MSTRLCQFGRKKHQLQDDLESFVHVVMYTALRYMRNNYWRDILQESMQIYNEGGSSKFAMFFDGLVLQLDLPDAPPLVRWIEKACDLGKEWLLSQYSKVRPNNRETDPTILLESDPVPETIGFHDHKALLELWKLTLDSEDWNKVTPHQAHDNLTMTWRDPEPKEKTESLQPPPSESAAVQSGGKSFDKPDHFYETHFATEFGGEV